MSLFMVEHRHTAENCPSSNAEMATALAGHVSPANATKFGVKVLSDCVLPGEHTLYLVVEADSPDQVANFATPFMNIGPTTIRPVITCEIVASQARD